MDFEKTRVEKEKNFSIGECEIDTRACAMFQ